MDSIDPHAEPPRYTNLDWDWPWWAKPAFLLSGVILPLICLAIGVPDMRFWKSDNPADYAELLLAHKSSAPLYPFFIYNMICMTLLVVRPVRYAKIFIVRLGIYTGLVLALQYWLLFGISLMQGERSAEAIVIFAGLSVLAVGGPMLAGWFVTYSARGFWLELVVTTAIGFSTAVVIIFPYVVLLIILVVLLCSTPWAVAAYAIMAVFVFRNSGVGGLRFTLARLLGVTTWAAAYCGAWRTAYLVMLQEYAKLPKTPPGNCYICTAAARGHRRLVRSEERLLPGGTVRRVNDQTRYFKAAELLLAAVSPGGHRLCRRIYDCLGPRLAALLIHPVVADVAYLSLKPLEWAVRAGLALLLPECHASIKRLYRC